MLELVIGVFMPEISAIEARTLKILKNCGSYNLHSLKFPQTAEKRHWITVLCLLSAKLAKDTNTKVIHLAGVLHLFNLASHLHLNLPEDFDTVEIQEEIQYPILVGDLLYSRVCGDICKYDLQQYLQPLASLIGVIHEELVLRDAKVKQNLPHHEHEINIYGVMTESTCFLGAHAAAGNNYLVENIRALGYQMGIIKAVWELNCEIEPYLNNWYKAWELLTKLPIGPERDHFQHILTFLGIKWGLVKPQLLTEINA